jgi:N-acetylgalactosamine kinase
MTIGYETLMAVAPRRDDRVRLFNCHPDRFPDREFSIGEMLSDLPWDDWLSLVNSDKVHKMISVYGVEWTNYIQAAVLRIQKKFSNRKLSGMDLVVWGNIPMAAGLSSSSSLVVGTAEAVVAANRLDTFPSQLVTLCGEGEWFVGTRGGSADHAAVKFGQKNRVVKVGFFEFSVEDTVPFPPDYRMAVCDSGIKACKSANAKDQFNHRITCYRIGLKLIRSQFPQYRHLVSHLRDVNVRNLGIPLSWIYRILLHLPEAATREELQEMLPGEDLEVFFRMHQKPEDGLYPIRGVVLFGLAECERSRVYAEFLKQGKINDIGELMRISHDGDRVARSAPDGTMVPYQAPTSNAYLLSLMEDLESGDIERVARAQLRAQPGSYHCSLPEIDRMVDLAMQVQGVAGAQLAGAGLGGCMMVLARRDAVEELVAKLEDGYYRPSGLPSSVLLCEPVAGSSVLMKN